MASSAAGPDAALRTARLFGIDGEGTDLCPLGRGHIHRTFLATYRRADGSVVRYVHQRLNTSVFADLDVLMGNFVRVTSHLCARAVDPRRALRLLPAADGRPLGVDAGGQPWRTLEYVEGAVSHQRFDNPAQAAKGAAMAARLVADLADLSPPPAEVIPGFHDIVRRLGDLDRARAADEVGRAGECRRDVDAILAHGTLAERVTAARADGTLAERSVHNDAKPDNLLFDAVTGEGLCLVDLDTVGPGTVLFDVGDLVRGGAARPQEDDPDRVEVDHDIVAAILESYAHAGAGFLTPGEADLLPLAGPLMALEAAARFLTDYLQGDVYFLIEGPGHNLRRARTQLRILELLLAG